MKKPNRFERNEIAWAAHKALYRPGLIAKVRASLPPGMPESGLAYVLEAFDAPSQATRSTTRSCAGKFPSITMGVTLGFDSSTIELPAAMTLERSPDVVAYLDQAPPLRITFRLEGRTRSYHHRPDFLVIYRGRAAVLECKRVAAIHEKNAKHPGFFVLGDDGRWTCPPGEASAAQLGMEYIVWTDADFGVEMIRNLRYLNHFVTPEPHPEIRPADEIQKYLESRGRATITAILEDLGSEVCIDDVLSAIARHEVVFDLRSAPLTSPDLCWLYRDDETLAAFSAIAGPGAALDVEVKGATTVSVRVGDELMWHGNHWDCLAVVGACITLSSKGAVQQLSAPVFLQLLDSGEMTLVGKSDNHSGYEQASKRLLAVPPEHLAIAVQRLARIKPFLDGGVTPPHERTLRRHLQKFRAGERAFGPGFGLVGLLPDFAACGNRSVRHPEKVVQLADEVIQEYFLIPDNLTRKATYLKFRGACEKLGYPTPAYSWLCGLISKLPKFETALARKGRKGAYSLEPRNWIEGLPSADFAFQVAHVDHTPLDLAVLLGLEDLKGVKVWLTVMLCAFSRRALAFALSYQPPSTRSVVVVMRECVRRHHRLPEKIIFDGGKEFGSVWTETISAIYKSTVQRRLVSKPRSGSEGERLFGTVTTQVINFLTGNTQLTKDVRSMSREVNPFNRAIWNVDRLKARLKDFFYDVYDTSKHTSLLCSPREAFESSVKTSGERASRFIRFDELFMILTCATPRKGHAKVQPDGVKINYIYYNAPELRAYLDKKVPVRFDQFNLSNAWAYVGSRWLKLNSRHASTLARFSQRDIEAVTTTWRQHRSDAERESLSEPKMIEFLERLSRDEEELLRQRVAIAERDLRSKDQDDDDDCIDEADDGLGAYASLVAANEPGKANRARLVVSQFHVVEEL